MEEAGIRLEDAITLRQNAKMPKRAKDFRASPFLI